MPPRRRPRADDDEEPRQMTKKQTQNKYAWEKTGFTRVLFPENITYFLRRRLFRVLLSYCLATVPGGMQIITLKRPEQEVAVSTYKPQIVGDKKLFWDAFIYFRGYFWYQNKYLSPLVLKDRKFFFDAALTELAVPHQSKTNLINLLETERYENAIGSIFEAAKAYNFTKARFGDLRIARFSDDRVLDGVLDQIRVPFSFEVISSLIFHFEWKNKGFGLDLQIVVENRWTELFKRACGLALQPVRWRHLGLLIGSHIQDAINIADIKMLQLLMVLMESSLADEITNDDIRYFSYIKLAAEKTIAQKRIDTRDDTWSPRSFLEDTAGQITNRVLMMEPWSLIMLNGHAPYDNQYKFDEFVKIFRADKLQSVIKDINKFDPVQPTTTVLTNADKLDQLRDGNMSLIDYMNVEYTLNFT